MGRSSVEETAAGPGTGRPPARAGFGEAGRAGLVSGGNGGKWMVTGRRASGEYPNFESLQW